MAIQDFEDWSTRVYWDYYFTILQDTPEGYGGAAKKSVIVNDTETGLNYSNANPDNHSDRHENGGADPISNLGGNVAFPDRSYFQVYMSQDQDLIASSRVKLLLDSVKVDNRNEFDAENNEVVIEASGFYLLSVNVTFMVGSDQDRIRPRIVKNGTDILLAVFVVSASVSYHTCCGAIGVYLTAGDSLSVEVANVDSDDAVDADYAYTNFSGCLIA